jgi:hypothetical protein
MNITVRAHKALLVAGATTFVLGTTCVAEATAVQPQSTDDRTIVEMPQSACALGADCEGQSSQPLPVSTSVGPMMHAMAPGETLGDVAYRYRCTWNELAEFNRSNPYLIPEGRVVTIPNCGASVDGRWSVGREVSVDPTPGKRYRVRGGESLERLGLRTGCSVLELVEANRYDDDFVFSGGLLEIPDCVGEEHEPALSVVPASSSRYLVSGADSLGGIAQYTGCSRRQDVFTPEPVRTESSEG